MNQLENERKEKIKALDLDEVKAYITNLNKKLFEALDKNNSDDVELYNNKLKEVFDLTSDKFVNLDFYSLVRKYEITTSKMIENNTKREITHKSLLSVVLTSSYIALYESYFYLDYLLMIYYHNYYTKENMLVDDLIAHLHCEYDFNNDKFDEYAYSKATKYNENLMGELDTLIGMIKSNANNIIELTDKYVSDDFENEVSSMLKEIDYEKQFVNKKGESDEAIKMLKEGKYPELLDSLKDSSILYLESCRNYVEIKEKIVGLMNSPDGFLELKESHYDFTNEKLEISMSKEEYIASRPSYDVKSLKFINS